PPPAAAIAADEIAPALPEALPDLAPDALADTLPDTLSDAVPTVEPPPAAAEVAGAVARVSDDRDDRDDIEPGDRVVLIVVADGDEARRADVEWYLRREGVRVDSAALGAEALQAVRSAAYDCVLLGPELGDMGPIELLKRLVESEAITEMPFVIYGTEGLGG